MGRNVKEEDREGKEECFNSGHISWIHILFPVKIIMVIDISMLEFESFTYIYPYKSSSNLKKTYMVICLYLLQLEEYLQNYYA